MHFAVHSHSFWYQAWGVSCLHVRTTKLPFKVFTYFGDLTFSRSNPKIRALNCLRAWVFMVYPCNNGA